MNTYTIEGGGSFTAILKHAFWGGKDVIFQSGTMPSVGSAVHSRVDKYLVTAVWGDIISLSKAPEITTPDRDTNNKNNPHKPWWLP